MMSLPSLLVYATPEMAQRVLPCARPTRAFLGRALREHRELTGLSLLLLSTIT
jgi:hypothetical protein